MGEAPSGCMPDLKKINRADPGRSRKSNIPLDGYCRDKMKQDDSGVLQSVCYRARFNG